MTAPGSYKKALITGASEGIGKAMAIRLAAEGYTITGVARSEEKLSDLTRSLGDGGHDYIQADLATGQGQDRIAGHLRQSNYDLLVNNVGVGTSGAFMDIAAERQISLLRLNIEAIVRLSHAFLERARPGNALVNVSSVLSFLPMPELGIYSASKSFVTSFSESLWFEQRKRGVYVMALHPGMTDTDFQIHAGGTKGNPPRGLAQTPEQVAEVLAKALHDRQNPTVISGTKNLIFSSLSRVLSRRMVVTLMGRADRG